MSARISSIQVAVWTRWAVAAATRTAHGLASSKVGASSRGAAGRAGRGPVVFGEEVVAYGCHR